jgi:hypothetical protein
MNRRYALTLAAALATYCGYAGAGDLNDPDVKDSYVQEGFAIAPVPLDLRGKSPGLVGLGSYIVNTAGCNDCHTWGRPPGSNWAPGGNPFIGQPAKINADYYLSGGRTFGPGVVAKNLTPDANGLPAG